MGYRLSRIYTRSGDSGTTGLADGSRIDKDAPRIEAIGAVDELNCAIGSLLAVAGATDGLEPLVDVQHRLFDLGGELAMARGDLLDSDIVERLERAIDDLNAPLPPLKEFVLPGGGPAAAQAHLARAVCRRAERALWRLNRDEAVNPVGLKFLNRLSDLLFVVARTLTRQQGPEEPWDHVWGDSGGE